VRVEQYLRQVIELEPAQPVALLGLTQIAIERGDLAAARTLLDRAPESPLRTRAHAELLALEGQFDASAQAFAQIFALQPSEAAAVRAYEMGRRAGRPNADAQLKQWNSEHPEAPAANFILASGALERDDLDTAQRHYDAVLAINPAHAPTLNNLAWIYGRRGDSRAMDFAERALAADPENPMIADTVGWLRVQNGNAARGLPLLTDAASRLPDQDEVQYHWAAALADTGDTARAIDILARLTASGRDFEGRADAERRLRDLRSAR
jgi:Tfp pilus assembly protein PilF